MFKLEISTDGAAFKDPHTGESDDSMESMEIQKIIMDQVLPALEDGAKSGKLRDTNGNSVGSWSREED